MCDYALQDFIMFLHKILGFLCYTWYLLLPKGNSRGNGDNMLWEKFYMVFGQEGRL
jgi:hypothetical protein